MNKGETTRRKIMEKAVTLFHRRGFHEVGIPEIGKAAGLSHAGVYRHFATKDDLFLACCRLVLGRAAERYGKEVDERLPARERLRAYLRTNFRWVKDYPAEMKSLMSLQYLSLSGSAFRELFAGIAVSSSERIEILIAQGVNEGAWRVAPERRPRLARHVHSLLFGEMTRLMGSNESEAAVFDAYWETVISLLTD
jgi:AcrR family transcriptional regulator